jgi:hypothetical protein
MEENNCCHGQGWRRRRARPWLPYPEMEQICRTDIVAGIETRKMGVLWWEVTQKRRGDSIMLQNAAAQSMSEAGLGEMLESSISLEPLSSRAFLRTRRTSGYRRWRWHKLRLCTKKRQKNFGHRQLKFAPLFSPSLTVKIQIHHPSPNRPLLLHRSKAMAGASLPAVMRSSTMVFAGVPSPSSLTSVWVDPLQVCKNSQTLAAVDVYSG